MYDISVNVFLLSTNKQKRSGQNVFLYRRFFFLRFETSQAPTTNNSENRDRTNKQTDKKKNKKNSTMIDDRRLLKPANEKTKQKNTEIFPPMSTYNYSYTTTQNKKNQFQKNVQMMKPVSSERENKKDKF